MLKLKDLIFLSEKNISEEQIAEQVEILNKNESFVNISRPATPDNGINIIKSIRDYIEIFDKESKDYKICKFVPASGAATRMFNRLISFYNNPKNCDLHDGDFYSVNYTLQNLNKFAFYDKLIRNCNNIEDKHKVVEKILYKTLNYANLPKGLIDFHKYDNDVRTSFEEHIHEIYELSSNQIDIHLTVSEEFLDIFKNKLKEIKTKIKIENINISFSFQDKSTDTIAIYEDGNIVREECGSILLRPGGHGALLKNLNELEYDIIFIKNIDNIAHASYFNQIIDYKKLLGGVLIDIVNKIKKYYNLSDDADSIAVNKVEAFLSDTFGLKFNFENSGTKEKNKILKNALNKPLRVCGMVKNTGEPGGGPFWVKMNDGTESLQIVEKAQIDLNNSKQQEYLKNSTHFNPVDMVCYMKNPEGEFFDLNNFVDKNASFVAEKNYMGKTIRVLEHPGLWNGAMADWLSVFVEVPLITFNPVKEINDLLRKEHLMIK